MNVTGLSPRAVLLAGLSIAVCSSAALALDPPLVTDIDDFFVFNSKGVPPVPDDYHLVVDGAVDTPLVVDMNDVRQYPTLTQMATLECAIPGGTTLLVGNAVWTGAPVRTLLETAGLPADAASVRFHALDLYSLGDFDLAEIQSSDGIMLAYEMNGQELPPEQGAPLRLVVPGAGGFNWVQFVRRIEVKSTPPTAEFDYLPQHARILSPLEGAVVTAEPQPIRGMAISGMGQEIARVEVSTDGGVTWGEATVLSEFVPNAWKIWEFTWQPPSLGGHKLLARTYDDTGAQQRSDKAYGWLGFVVNVTVDEDVDADGVADAVDNCPDAFNPSQRDSDRDGAGDVCDADCPDLDGLSPVSFFDFAFFASQWRAEQSGPFPADLNGDLTADILDMQILASHWLTTCTTP